jgi:hypothetical protein
MATSRSRSAAAKKAARTRKRNAAARSRAAKKAARTRKSKGLGAYSRGTGKKVSEKCSKAGRRLVKSGSSSAARTLARKKTRGCK